MNFASDFAAQFCGLAWSLPHSSSGLSLAGHSALGLTSPHLSRVASTLSAICPVPTSSSFVRMERLHLYRSNDIIGPLDRVPMAERHCSSPLSPFLAIRSR